MTSFQKLGWVLVAAIAAALATAGFQSGLEKVASVDLSAMVETSDMGKASVSALEAMKANREGLLKFIDENRVLTVDQGNRLRALWIKDGPTAADTASLNTLKAEVTAQAAKNVELGQKRELTPEERTLLQEYANRSATMEQIAQQWFQEFSNEIQASAQQRRVATLEKARAAAQTVSKAQGFTLVFDSSVAVYTSNDLTADALKAMNAAK